MMEHGNLTNNSWELTSFFSIRFMAITAITTIITGFMNQRDSGPGLICLPGLKGLMKRVMEISTERPFVKPLVFRGLREIQVAD